MGNISGSFSESYGPFQFLKLALWLFSLQGLFICLCFCGLSGKGFLHFPFPDQLLISQQASYVKPSLHPHLQARLAATPRTFSLSESASTEQCQARSRVSETPERDPAPQAPPHPAPRPGYARGPAPSPSHLLGNRTQSVSSARARFGPSFGAGRSSKDSSSKGSRRQRGASSDMDSMAQPDPERSGPGRVSSSSARRAASPGRFRDCTRASV